jgi:type VI protein secretion system component Hcp
MAIDSFIKIGDIKGESNDKEYKDWIDVLSFSLESQAGNRAAPAFHFVKQVDQASPALFVAACGGTTPTQALFVTRKASGAQGKLGGVSDFFKITMKEVFISSLTLSGDAGGVPTETLSLRFAEAAVDVNGAAAPGVCAPPPKGPGHDRD